MRFYIQSILLGLMSLAVVVGATVAVRGWEQERLHNEFHYAADAYKQLLIGRLRDIGLELNSIQRFFHGSAMVDRDEFTSFVSKIISSSGEILAVSWVPKVPTASRSAFEANHFQDELSGRFVFDRPAADVDAEIRRSPKREVHFPILYAEPMKSMDRFIGADMAADEHLVELLEQARDEGMIVPVTRTRTSNLPVETKIISSVTLIQPVYRTPRLLTTIKERREEHQGFVLLQYDVGVALETALRELQPQGFDMFIVDVEAEAGSEIVYFHRSRLADKDAPTLTYDQLWQPNDFIFKSELNVSGRQWKLMVVPVAQYFELRKEYQAVAVLIFGLVLSLFLFYVLFSHHRRARDIQDTVERRTRELEISEARQRAVVENVSEGIITFDERGHIEAFNHAAEKIFDYQADEVRGRNVSLLIPENGQEESAASSAGKGLFNPHFSTQLRTVRGVRKDGREIPIELGVSRMTVDGEVKFVGIMHDITERLKTEHVLKTSKDMAEKANRAKSEFLSSMSHELRTPMNAILGFGQMLQMNAKEPLSEGQKSCLDHIMKGGKHLLELINQVLDLSRIEAGKVDLFFEAVSPNEVIAESLTLILTIAQEKGIKVDAPDPNGALFPRVWADHMRLKQVLLNLMSNAVKYNRDGGSVTLAVERKGEDRLRFSVADTGPGIPEQKQRELFKPFARLDANETGVEGTGIGLVITKDLVELMDGEIGLESDEGRGATFWVEIPLAERVADAYMERSGGTSTDVSEEATPVKGILLYVEDNPDNLRLMGLIVGQVEGLSMLSAHTAELGIELARTRRPDIIILDINLPGINGLEAAAQLLKDEKTKNIPILALSAAATKRDVRDGLKAGFSRYLTKPISVPDVLSAIEDALNRS